jgi:hypothetical protein
MEHADLDRSPTQDSAADAILKTCAARPDGTIDPSDAARTLAAARGEDDLGWRSHLTAVRQAAVRLADHGALVIYRKGKPVDPHDFRGVYRLGLPSAD